MTNHQLSIRHIVCPTDFSDPSVSAYGLAIRLAKCFAAKLTVLHAMPPAAPVIGEIGYVSLSGESRDALRRDTLARLHRFVDATRHAGVAVDVVCREGHAAETIQSTIGEVGADAVVMGTHGRTGLARLVLGSVTEALLRQPPCPIFTVNRPLLASDRLFRSVLCAGDQFGWSASTIAAATFLTAQRADRLVLLSVLELGASASRDDANRAALAALDIPIPERPETTFSIERRFAIGEIDRQVMATAQADRADLIVMEMRGGSAGRALDGSVMRVVRDAPCAVLVMPASHVWHRRVTSPEAHWLKEAELKSV